MTITHLKQISKRPVGIPESRNLRFSLMQNSQRRGVSKTFELLKQTLHKKLSVPDQEAS